MTAFHFFSFTEQEIARSDQIAELFKELQDDLFTGIAEFYEDDACFIAIFAQGRIATLYHLNGRAERLNGEKWITHIEKSDGQISIRSLSLPVTDLRYFKILIESLGQGQNTDTEWIAPKTILEKLHDSPGSSLIFGETNSFAFLNYYAGLDPDRSRSVMITPERIQNGSFEELLQALPTDLKNTSVMSIVPEDPGSAWVEQQYYEIFARALKEFMRIYGSMRERVYLNKIIRAINFKADAKDVLIIVNARDVNDQQIFDSPAKTAKIYSELLALVAIPLKNELGEQVFAEVLDAIRAKSHAFQIDLLDQLLSGNTQQA